MSNINASDASGNAADGKSWWQSRTVWGSLIVIVGQILPLLGIQIPADVAGQAVDLAATGAGVIGGALALYGRVKAVAPIR